MRLQTYDISVVGELGESLHSWFDDVDVTVGRGSTQLRVVCSDEAMLHGILDRLDALGLELLDVHPVTAPPAGSPGDR